MSILNTIHPSQLPTKIPLTFPVVVYLLMDNLHSKFDIHPAVDGVVWTFIGFYVLLSVILFWKQKSTKVQWAE